MLNDERRPTKREILSLLMTVLEPLGLVTHFTTKLKILQDVWRTKIGWDDELPIQFTERWSTWLEELRRITEVQVPRCYSPLLPNATDLQLHLLVDASQEAFSAVIYWRIKIGEDVHVAFIQGKSRISPLRPMSIPRLELQATVLGTRMVPTIKKFQQILVHSTHFWSDSRTVLLWHRLDARRLNPLSLIGLVKLKKQMKTQSGTGCHLSSTWLTTLHEALEKQISDQPEDGSLVPPS